MPNKLQPNRYLCKCETCTRSFNIILILKWLNLKFFILAHCISKLKTQIYHVITTQTFAFSGHLAHFYQKIAHIAWSVAHLLLHILFVVMYQMLHVKELHIVPMNGDAFAIKHFIVSCLCTKIISTRKSLDKSKQLLQSNK